MPGPLDNPRHEKFAQAVAGGETGAEAYRAIWGTMGKSAEQSASRLRKEVKVASRIDEICQGYREHVATLEVEASLKSETERATIVATKDEILKMMTETLRAKPSDASLDNPLCDLKMSKAGPYPAFIDKVRAAERICEIMGYNAAQKVEVKDTTPRESLSELRARVQALKFQHSRD